MESHPKYTLEYNLINTQCPYLIVEHAVVSGAMCYKEYGRSSSFEDALKMLYLLSSGNIILAISAQKCDNTFDVSRG